MRVTVSKGRFLAKKAHAKARLIVGELFGRGVEMANPNPKPILRRYLVTLVPARRIGEVATEIRFGDSVGIKPVELSARYLSELEEQIRVLARAKGGLWAPIVTLANPKERKPYGFDAWARGLRTVGE
jgi:hypothetical protein